MMRTMTAATTLLSGTPLVRTNDDGQGVESSPRLINGWFWITGLTGLLVCVASGWTRQFSASEELTSLSYVASSSWAMVFAATTFLPCLIYAKQARLYAAEGILIWFVLNTAVHAKDFAYVQLPGSPLYISDTVLAFLCTYVLWTRSITPNWPRVASYATFIAAGLVAFSRGLMGEQELILILRDSAIPIYSMFAVAAVLVVRSWRSLHAVLIFMAMGAALSSVSAVAWLAAQPGQRRYIGFGVYVLAGLLGTLLAVTNRRIPASAGWPLAIVMTAGVLLANARTIFVALAVAVAVIIVFGVSVRRRGGNGSRLKMMTALMATAALVLAFATQTQAGGEIVARASAELVSGIAKSDHDANAQFRFLAWEEALARFGENPLVGEGFGVPFVFERSGADVRPHNTYLTVLYKMGFLGAVPFALIIVGFQRSGGQTPRRSRSHPEAVWLYALLLAHLTMCLFGALNLLLESPFLASMFWIVMGLGYRSIELLRDAQATVQPASIRCFRVRQS